MIDEAESPSALIVDASVGVKWLIPEIHSDHASLLMVPGVRRVVPSLFFTEASQTIWKKAVVRHEISVEEAREAVRRLLLLPLEICPIEVLYESSFEIALETGRSVCDSLYLALAVTQGCRLVTADQRLYNSLSEHPLRSNLLWIADVPLLFVERPSRGV